MQANKRTHQYAAILAGAALASAIGGMLRKVPVVGQWVSTGGRPIVALVVYLLGRRLGPTWKVYTGFMAMGILATTIESITQQFLGNAGIDLLDDGSYDEYEDDEYAYDDELGEYIDDEYEEDDEDEYEEDVGYYDEDDEEEDEYEEDVGYHDEDDEYDPAE